MKVSETKFREVVASLTDGNAIQGQFYTFSTEPELAKPWFCIDTTVKPAKKAIFAIEAEALAYFDVINGSVPENGKDGLTYPQDSSDAASTAQASTNSVPETVSDGASLEKKENLFVNLSDADLEAAIKAHENGYHNIARECLDVETTVTTLRAEFDKEHGEMIKSHKALKDAQAAAKEELKVVAAEYARRHPTDKQFDTFIAFKEFEDVNLDEVEALRWARGNYPIAIIPAVGERLDVKAVVDVIKSLKRNKKDIPPFVEFVPRVEVQVSSKLPAANGNGVEVPATENVDNVAATIPFEPWKLDPSDPNYTPF